MSAARSTDAPLSLAEHVCLALVVEGVAHGWAIGSLLAPDGELGRVWSVSRPLTYRAIDVVVARGLLDRAGVEAGRGRDRQVLAPTAAGRRETRVWLDRPVAHLRDLRSELLLKLTLRRRRGLPVSPLLEAQLVELDPVFAALAKRHDGDDLTARWRAESARAARRFLEGALAAEAERA